MHKKHDKSSLTVIINILVNYCDNFTKNLKTFAFSLLTKQVLYN